MLRPWLYLKIEEHEAADKKQTTEQLIDRLQKLEPDARQLLEDQEKQEAVAAQEGNSVSIPLETKQASRKSGQVQTFIEHVNPINYKNCCEYHDYLLKFLGDKQFTFGEMPAELKQ